MSGGGRRPAVIHVTVVCPSSEVIAVVVVVVPGEVGLVLWVRVRMKEGRWWLRVKSRMGESGGWGSHGERLERKKGEGKSHLSYRTGLCHNKRISSFVKSVSFHFHPFRASFPSACVENTLSALSIPPSLPYPTTTTASPQYGHQHRLDRLSLPLPYTQSLVRCV